MAEPSPHILVVDDESCVREALTAALHPAYVVHTAASGAEACSLLRAHPIAAIILDAILNGEHGLDLVGRFRAIASAPILLLTGHGSEELAGRAVWAGVNGYLKKPISVSEVHAALTRVNPHWDGPAARARRDLDEQFAKPLRTAELAHRLGVSEAHLRRCFRAAYGKTPRRYLTEGRMRRTAILLSMTRLGVERIALDVGFPNVVWFTKCFRRAYEVSPTEFRARRGRLPSQGGKGEDPPPA